MLENYKIKVNDEAESKEAQELFAQLEYIPFEINRVGMVATDNGEIYPDVIGNWDKYGGEELTLPQLRDLVAQSKSNEQGLISGADALADITNVQHNYEDRDDWHTTQYSTLTIQEILKGETTRGIRITFRLKPRTITLSLEIPAPFEPKNGDLYWVVDIGDERLYSSAIFSNSGDDKLWVKLGAWDSEEKIKQVVAALKQIKSI